MPKFRVRCMLCGVAWCFAVAAAAPAIHGQDRSADGFDVYQRTLTTREQVRDLEASRPAVVSKALVMNTVRQFGDRQGLNGYLAERSAEAKVWQRLVAAGAARRMEVVNPYERSSYVKYYDDKGNWRFSVIEDDFRVTERLREDWISAYRRARATADDVRRDFDALVAQQGLPATLMTEVGGMLSSASERMGQFGQPPLELLPRPVEGQVNSPFPTYKAFDSYTGNVIRIGRVQANGRSSEGQSSGGNRPAQDRQGSKIENRRPSVAGTAWKWLNNRQGNSIPYSYVYFDANGRFEGTESTPDRGIVDNTFGTWRQDGKNIAVAIRSEGGSGNVQGTELFMLDDGVLMAGNSRYAPAR